MELSPAASFPAELSRSETTPKLQHSFPRASLIPGLPYFARVSSQAEDAQAASAAGGQSDAVSSEPDSLAVPDRAVSPAAELAACAVNATLQVRSPGQQLAALKKLVLTPAFTVELRSALGLKGDETARLSSSLQAAPAALRLQLQPAASPSSPAAWQLVEALRLKLDREAGEEAEELWQHLPQLRLTEARLLCPTAGKPLGSPGRQLSSSAS